MTHVGYADAIGLARSVGTPDQAGGVVTTERRVHFAGSPLALTGYGYAPCGARLRETDSVVSDGVTCRHCLNWLARLSPTD